MLLMWDQCGISAGSVLDQGWISVRLRSVWYKCWIIGVVCVCVRYQCCTSQCGIGGEGSVWNHLISVGGSVWDQCVISVGSPLWYQCGISVGPVCEHRIIRAGGNKSNSSMGPIGVGSVWDHQCGINVGSSGELGGIVWRLDCLE